MRLLVKTTVGFTRLNLLSIYHSLYTLRNKHCSFIAQSVFLETAGPNSRVYMAEIWNFETKTDCPSPFKLCSQQNRSSYFLHIPVVLLSVAISREQRIKHISYMNCRVTKNQNSLVRSAWYHRDISSTVSHSTRLEWLSELRIRLGSVCLCPLWPERR